MKAYISTEERVRIAKLMAERGIAAAEMETANNNMRDGVDVEGIGPICVSAEGKLFFPRLDETVFDTAAQTIMKPKPGLIVPNGRG